MFFTHYLIVLYRIGVLFTFMDVSLVLQYKLLLLNI